MSQFTGSLEISGSLFINNFEVFPGGGGGGATAPAIYFLDTTPNYVYSASSTVHVSESGKFYLFTDNGLGTTETYSVIWYPELLDTREPTNLGFYTNSGTGTAMSIVTKVSCSIDYEWWSANPTVSTGSIVRTSLGARYFNSISNAIQNGYKGLNGSFYAGSNPYVNQTTTYKKTGPIGL